MMKFLMILAVAMFAMGSGNADAQSATCDAFRHNPDGSWTNIKPILLGRDTDLAPGVAFVPGVIFLGLDLGTDLNHSCGDRDHQSRGPTH